MSVFIIWATLSMSIFLIVIVSVEPQWVVLLCHRLHLRRAVWIEHFDGEVQAHFLRRNARGGLWCHSEGCVGHAVLLDDGTVKQPSYVKKWGYLER